VTDVARGEVGAEPGAEMGLNPFAPGFFEDPYRQYRELREQAPVHHNPLGPWTITRYEDCA
jgi:cytochrome P450